MNTVVIARSNQVEPDSRVEKEANTLALCGYRVILLTWDRSANYRIKKDKKKLEDVTVERVSFGARAGFGYGLKSLGPYVRFQVSLFLWLLCNRKIYDVCHLCDFDTAFTGSHACKLIHKKYIFDIFDYLSTDANTVLRRMLQRLENKIIDDADATIICTEERREQIKLSHPRKLVVIHNSPVKIDFYERIAKETKNIKIVYVGILQDYRLLKEMVHAIALRRDVELHIGGFGKYEQYIEEQANKYQNIKYYGKLSYKDTIKLESECDIITAIYDPQIGNHRYAAPNKFYEGLMLGKPLIMVKGTGMSDVVQREGLGEVINFSEESFIYGLDRLVEKKSIWDEIGEKMKRIYDQMYSWDEMAKRLQKLYVEVLNV